MDQWEQFARQLIELMGFKEFRVEVSEEFKHGTIMLEDYPPYVKENLGYFVENINRIFQLVAKKNDWPPVFFDVNNYRRQRETLITELARAAAQKALATKKELTLPPMNSYERRVVHTALVHHPEVKTESIGEGKGRCVVIKPI